METPELKWPDAPCTLFGDDVFFPETANRSTVARAAAICKLCPHSQECLEAAMLMERGLHRSYRHGVWGGLSPNGRHKLALSRGEVMRHTVKAV